MKKFLEICLLSLVCCFVNAHASDIDPIFNVIWDASLGMKPDESDPKWRLSGVTEGTGAKGSDEFVGDVLRFDTPKDETIDGKYLPYRVYFIDSASRWNPVKNPLVTIEFSARVLSVAAGADYSTCLAFYTGTTGYVFALDEMGISTNDGEAFAFDTSEFHVFRVTLDAEGVAKLYMDGASEPIITTYGAPSENRAVILFGSRTNTTGGVSEWKYLAYTTNGAFPTP